MKFIIQLTVVVVCLLYDARKGGIGLGLAGGCGILTLVWIFDLQPGQPSVDVMLIIIAVVAASATLQASGGLDVLLQLAEKLLRRNPKYISLVTPLVNLSADHALRHRPRGLYPVAHHLRRGDKK